MVRPISTRAARGACAVFLLCTDDAALARNRLKTLPGLSVEILIKLEIT
jgi:hypothetical protein